MEVSDLRFVLQDQRVWTGLGVVQPPPGETHFIIEEDDVLVEVQLMPNKEQLLCRLGSFGGGPGGIWNIPPIGAEVAVLVPTGEFEADPIIIGTLSTGNVPDGLSGDTIVIVARSGAQVLIHDGDSGETEPLIRKTEFDSHFHAVQALPNPAPVFIATTPISAPLASNPAGFPVTGTSVLRAK